MEGAPRLEVMSALLEEARQHWEAIGPLLKIRNDRDHAAAVEHLNDLLDEVGDDEHHPLYGLLDTLGTLIQAYEEEHVPIPDAGGSGALAFLMEEHGLGAGDLPELGSAEIVRAVLADERKLHPGEIRALAERFGISPTVFIADAPDDAPTVERLPHYARNDEPRQQPGSKGLTLAEVVKSHIEQVLDRVGNNQARAAKLLGLPLPTLRAQMMKLGISR